MFMITATAEEVRLEGVRPFFLQISSYFYLKVLSGPSGGDGGTIWQPRAGVRWTEGLSERN